MKQTLTNTQVWKQFLTQHRHAFTERFDKAEGTKQSEILPIYQTIMYNVL